MAEKIIYDSLSGNTKELAETIKKERKNAYIEKISNKLTTEIENIEDRMIHVVLIIPKTYSFRI